MTKTELKIAKKEEVKQWVNEKITFIMTECDLQNETNKKVLENFLNIQENLSDLSRNKLTEQTKLWVEERIKFIYVNASEYDEKAMKTLEYFKYIQSL